MHQPVFFVCALLIGSAFAADLLQNSDFETPPLHVPKNSTPPHQLLDENSTIPGWSFEGTVAYVSSSRTVALPEEGHAIQLLQDGKINQTFHPNVDYSHYLLTFVLVPGGQNCSDNASIGVSAPDSHAVFSFKQHYGKQGWQTYGVYLGSWEQQEPVNLVIESDALESDANLICWPVIDSLLLKIVESLAPGNDNLLVNGGFEVGPEFPSGSTEGILIEQAPSPVLSALRGWSITGTVRYIDSKHYFVPEGKAAVEIVSGVAAGMQTSITVEKGSSYKLEFTLGDARDSCQGSFVVGVQAGPAEQNFTLQSNGTGSAEKLEMAFKADSITATVTFVSYSTTQTKDGVFCGPVIDNVVVRASHGMKPMMKWEVLLTLLFLALILC